MKILYEDNHLIAVDKEAGLPTQVSNEHPIALETKLKDFIKIRDQKKGNVFLHAVHRLDKGVSGIVLFAKTSKALSRIQESIREKKLVKTYLAIVEGIPKQSEKTLIHNLVKKEHKSIVSKSSDAKKAELHYKVIRAKNTKALLKIDLITGRYHQIRAQLSFIKHPIVGDVKYGSKKESKRLLLRHTKLTFPHVITNEMIKVSADEKEFLDSLQ